MTLDSIHIATSEAPLESGVEQRALCGVLIPHAQWLWTTVTPGGVDRQRAKTFFGFALYAKGFCGKCWLADWTGCYVYAMVTGK